MIYFGMSQSFPDANKVALTDLSSASLEGLGHVPGSRLMARKKLYAHKPKVSANER